MNSGCLPLPDLVDRLRAALTRRYAIERELGRGGPATAASNHPHFLPLHDSREVDGFSEISGDSKEEP